MITGSPQTTHNGIPIARVGDKVMCKKCEKVVTIVTGDPAFIIDGAPVARGGDVTNCGPKLIANQQAFAESGFDVMGIEPPAPLQFPKSDMSNTLIDSAPDEAHFAIEVIEFNSKGDYLGSYDLADNPSHLSADISGFGSYSASNPNLEWDPDVNAMMPKRQKAKNNEYDPNRPWFEQDQKAKALANETINVTTEHLRDYWGNASSKGKKLANDIADIPSDIKNDMVIYLGIIERGLTDFPERTKASAATAMLQFGQRANVDFVYIAGGIGVKHFGLDIGMAVNVHNGNVYEPVNINANVNTNKAPAISAQIGVGRIVSSSEDNNRNATDAVLSGQGHSYSVEMGPISAALETTQDGTTVAASSAIGRDWTINVKGQGNSSIGASKGSTNMKLIKNMKYSSSKNIIEYTGR